MSLDKKTIVVAGAPGVGKSHLFSEAEKRDLSIRDSDSSQFSWLQPGVRNPDFPYNYMEHLRSLLGEVDVVCVSTHHEVRNALVAAGIEFKLTYPGPGQKDEYIKRFRDRPLKPGEDQAARDKFVALMNAHWEEWIDKQLPTQEGCAHVVLQKGEYLSDRIMSLLTE